MPKIFISYRRADSKAYAGRLHDRLVTAFGPENVFMDVNNDNIPLGRDFRGVLRESVARCDVLLAIIGKQWLTIKDDDGNKRLDNPNDFVRIEIESALQRDTCLVIPLTVDGAYMPAAKDLPDALRELSFKNGTALRDDPDFHNDVGRVIRTLGVEDPHKKLTFPATPPTMFNVYEAIDKFEVAFKAKKWDRAFIILNEIRASRVKIPSSFDIDAHEQDTLAEIELDERYKEYKIIREMAKRPNPKAQRIWEALQAFWKEYPDYDPDDLARFKPLKAQDYFDRAENYREKGDYDRAITDYTEVIRLNPHDAIAYHNRGNSHHYKQDYDRAIADYTEAIRLNPHDAIAYVNRGFSYHEKKDHDRAIADYTEAIRLNPGYANIYNRRGLSYYSQKDYDRAIADLNEAIRLNPHDAIAYNRRGLSYYSQKDYDRAIIDLTEAIRLNPQYADAYVNRGVSYYLQRDFDRAIVDYEAALRIDPNDPIKVQNLQNARDALRWQKK